jgi:IMP dehydrogenase/GMP reductase
MFVQAVRLTATLGPGFGVPTGTVSAPMDVVVIPRQGAIEITRIPSW